MPTLTLTQTMPALIHTRPLAHTQTHTQAHYAVAKIPALLRLPQELMDDILADLEHADLVSLALVSRGGNALVIPRHTEYRILRTRHLLPAVWAHLARRADLARGIREVHITTRTDHSASDRVPRALVDRTDEKLAVEPAAPPTVTKGHEDRVLAALAAKPTLRHLALSGMFGVYAPGLAYDPESRGYPLWGFQNLTSISLRGDAWIKPGNAGHLKRMLGRSSGLEFIELPMEFSTLAECKFPALKKLNLFLQAGGSRSIDPCFVRFLNDHPTIEDLSWLPLGPVYLSPRTLPSLRRVRTNVQVCLDIYQLDPATLVELRNLHGGSVRKVKLHAFGDLATMRELATLFPDLTWLSMPSRYGDFSLVTLNMERMHGVIMQLVQMCPHLRQLDHSGHNSVRQDWNRIKIIREGPEGENVRYTIDRPPAKRWFDALEGAFD
ncbi:hypothetical protein C8R46DRAFT_1082808 [Mycena filopes]|nr:hypothetical protein C8R46DRAFT_1082808 [Mycena filopes]